MSPLDDELRAALRGRASVLTPAPDPLAGIERRAKRIRRNRVAASVAGSALAVAAIALAGAALAPSALPDRTPPPFATAGPTPVPSPAPSPASTALALDPAAPWPYRGDPEVKVQGDLDAYVVEFASKRGVLTDDVRLSPLFGQVYEPSGTPELVYVATVTSSGQSWWGVARASESGPELLVDVPLPDGATALPATLPGDEVARLLVVAAPEVDSIEYGPDDASEWVAMTQIADGVAVRPLEGDPATDQVRVLGSDGQVVFQGPAPDSDSGSPSSTGPDNLLDWPVRGVADASLEERAARGFAAAKGVARADVSFSVLFTGNNDPGQRYTVLQAWVAGQPAHIFGWVESPGRDPEPQLRPVTEPGTAVVAILLTEIPGRTTDELVLMPRPGTAEVLYKASGADQGRPVMLDGLDGVALVDRELGAEGDSIVLLDGDGTRTLQGPVSDLLCGQTSCS